MELKNEDLLVICEYRKVAYEEFKNRLEKLKSAYDYEIEFIKTYGQKNFYFEIEKALANHKIYKVEKKMIKLLKASVAHKIKHNGIVEIKDTLSIKEILVAQKGLDYFKELIDDRNIDLDLVGKYLGYLIYDVEDTLNKCIGKNDSLMEYLNKKLSKNNEEIIK